MKTIFILFIIILTNISLEAQNTLKIIINNLENNNGFVLLDFRDGNDNKLKEITQKISKNKCIITIIDLKPGKYSFKYFHDENNNKKLDTYLIGAPKEGYGFANNAKGLFGPPSFETTIIEIKKNTTLICKPTYINF